MLSGELLEQYRSDGFVVLRGALPQRCLDAVRGVMERYVDECAETWFRDGWISDRRRELDFTTRYAALRDELPPRFSNIWRRVLVSPELWSLWQEEALLSPVRSIVGDHVYAHGIWNGRPRTAHDAMRIAWHQDAHYYDDYRPEHDPLVTCWIPLLPVDEADGCLQLIPGSHRLGMVDPVTRDDGQRTVEPSVIDALLTDGNAPRSIVMAPTDVLLFDACMLHQALPNRTDRVRWSLDIRFCRAEIGEQRGGLGYVCHGGERGTFEDWAQQYRYEGMPLADVDDPNVVADLAATLNVPVSELREF